MTSLVDVAPTTSQCREPLRGSRFAFLKPRSRRGEISGISRITRGLTGLRLSLVNVFFIADTNSESGTWVLVDAGLATSFEKIRKSAEALFGDLRPSAIVLTHGHFDHVGALARLARYWDVPVFAHELEMPYLTGRSSYPPPDPVVGGGTLSCLSRFFPRGPINLGRRVQPLPSDGTVPFLPEWKWIHTPGHTAGHVSLFRESDRALIAGDAFVTAKQESAVALLRLPPAVHRPPAYFTTDWPAAFTSVNLLKNLEPQLAVTGHGGAIHGEKLRRGLEKVAQNWDAFVPSRGRYVHEPAVTDQRGVVHLPPAVTDIRLIAYSAVAAAGIASAIYLASTRAGRRKAGPLERVQTFLAQAWQCVR